MKKTALSVLLGSLLIINTAYAEEGITSTQTDETIVDEIQIVEETVKEESIIEENLTEEILTEDAATEDAATEDAATEDTATEGTTEEESTLEGILSELNLSLEDIQFSSDEEAQSLISFLEELVNQSEGLNEEEKMQIVKDTFNDYIQFIDESEDSTTEPAIDVEENDEIQEETDSDLEEGIENEPLEDEENTNVIPNVVKELDLQKIISLKEQGLGYGQIAQVFLLAEVSGKDIDEISTLFNGEEKGFGEVAKELGLHPSYIKGKSKKWNKVEEEQPLDEEKEEVISEEEKIEIMPISIDTLNEEKIEKAKNGKSKIKKVKKKINKIKDRKNKR